MQPTATVFLLALLLAPSAATPASAAPPSAASTPADAPAAGRDGRGPPPAPHCFSARDVIEVRQSDPRTLALRLGDESRYRVELADPCPDALRSARLALNSRQGWICGSNQEVLDLGDRRCAVAGLARIDARQYADLALRSDRGGGIGARRETTLDTIEVRTRRRPGFGGTTAYCLDARFLRGWNEDDGGLVVDVSPRRNGGNRSYRVELGGSCSEMSSAVQMQLVSGVGGTAICGNVGDRAVFLREENIGGVLRPLAEGGLAARHGCSITAVYPVLARDAGNAPAPR